MSYEPKKRKSCWFIFSLNWWKRRRKIVRIVGKFFYYNDFISEFWKWFTECLRSLKAETALSIRNENFSQRIRMNEQRSSYAQKQLDNYLVTCDDENVSVFCQFKEKRRKDDKSHCATNQTNWHWCGGYCKSLINSL